MKKIIFLLSATFLLTLAVRAQTTIKPTIGLNLTDFSSNKDGDAKGKVGYQIGGSVAFGKKFYIEPGIFYVGKSTKFSDVNTSIATYDANIKGIRIPVAVGINLLGDAASDLSLRLFGGPSAFFVTSTDNINKDQINTTHWGLFAGAGIDFWKVFLDLSYEWSLTNIQKDISQIEYGKSRSLYVNAGFRFNLK